MAVASLPFGGLLVDSRAPTLSPTGRPGNEQQLPPEDNTRVLGRQTLRPGHFTVTGLGKCATLIPHRCKGIWLSRTLGEGNLFASKNS